MTGHAERRFNAGVDVANPIYDVVFTYLMRNDRIARLLIGRITGLAVQSLSVSPPGTALRRTPEDPEHDLPLTLLRMTFAARVQTHDGSERQVLIEILKANAQTEIKRYRLYLGQQIGSADNILTGPSSRIEAVPIVTIYFLRYALDGLSDEAVIDVCPRVTERRTGRELQSSHPLVEGIHHRSHIIQIPRLARRRRDELERLLAIFDQGLVKGNGRGDAHVLTIEEGEYPAECAFVLRRLREAMAEEEVRRYMEGEDLLFRDSKLLMQQVRSGSSPLFLATVEPARAAAALQQVRCSGVQHRDGSSACHGGGGQSHYRGDKGMTRSSVVAGLIVAALVACSSVPDPATGIEVTGRVIVTGSEPHTILVLDTEEAYYQLVGEHADALWRLQGRQVTVRGRVVGRAHGPGFPARLEVDDFQVLPVPKS